MTEPGSKKECVAVVGGISLDLHVYPDSAGFRRGTSNPAVIKVSDGGVARNIAENLARLDVATRLYGVLGTDSLSDGIVKRSREAGVVTTEIERRENAGAGVYVALVHRDGSLEVAASDMRAVDQVDPDFVSRHRGSLQEASMILADANLSRAALQALLTLANEAGIPLILEPVSVGKAPRLAQLQGEVFAVTPNQDEDRAIEEALTSRGPTGPRIAHTITTRGARGVGWRDNQTGDFVRYAAAQVSVVDSTGAGDAFVSGLVAALLLEADMATALRFATEAAAEVVSSEVSALDAEAGGRLRAGLRARLRAETSTVTGPSAQGGSDG